MIKPDIVTRSAYDYRDVITYIETKYKIKISNIEYPDRCKIKYKRIYPNITYWFINNLGWYSNHYPIHILNVKSLLVNVSTPSWIKRVLKILYKEFKLDIMFFWK